MARKKFEINSTSAFCPFDHVFLIYGLLASKEYKIINAYFVFEYLYTLKTGEIFN